MTQEPIAWLVSPDGGIQLNKDYWQLTMPSKLLEWKIPLYLHPSNDEALLRQALEALDSDHPDLQLRAALALRERLGDKT